ncbi:MAG: hypothetical protein HWE26_06970 [Alteromonadaceae bacterium]|nr:hypothetical protein [Alteromonadaceae bacterium]
MPIKKWLGQYAIALPVLCVIFTLTQYLKGHAIDDAIEFAVFWAIVTLMIFALTRAYNFHRNRYCALCNDIPAPSQTDHSEEK